VPGAAIFRPCSAMSNLRLLDPVFGDNFESSLRRFFPPTLFEGEAAQLKMRIDVTENDKAYTVKADIPGVQKEDIDVHLGQDVDASGVQAKYADGVLTLELPKKAPVNASRIAIQ